MTPVPPRSPMSDEKLMIRPLRCSIMWGAAALMHAQTPFRLVAITSSNSVSLMSHNMLTRVMPALLTRMSMPPKASTACPTSRCAPSMVATLS
jgi:hypothetical protein